ncbi:Ada metal-binding domain-containing protein [Butyrivibrio sp. XPD2002]|uniref:Ada metal-binding domain-containing protein n=1 Tax=Butyrivibrio sp. XPD2002 TaxID=1280665 RepID=UPI0009DC1C56|nr:Ada metal-binding domain-containing protein [Butyrivibrio sp. XPD2002]
MKMIIRKTIMTLAIVTVMIAGGHADTISVIAANGDTVVYITKTGDCYHKDGCSSLSHSKIQTTLKDAVDNGYRPCKRCKPPIFDN